MAIAGSKLANLAALKVIYDDLRSRLEALIDDTAGDGDTGKVYSADKVHDLLAALPDPTSIIDDSAGNGDTDKVYSADKVYDLLDALPAPTSIIDDTAGDGDAAKTWSADKIHDVLAALPTLDDTAGDGDTDKVYSADKVHDLLAALPAPSSIIDDTAGDGTTNKTWSANKIFDSLAAVSGVSVTDLMVAIGESENVRFGVCESSPSANNKVITTTPASYSPSDGDYLWVLVTYGNSYNGPNVTINGNGAGYLETGAISDAGLYLLQYKTSMWNKRAYITTQNGHMIYEGTVISGTYPKIEEHSSISTWSANTQYSVGDWVKKYVSAGYSGGTYSYYVCKEANQDSTFDSSKWAVVGEGYSSSSKFFTDDEYYKEIVGGGTSASHANIRTLDKFGNERIAGSLTIGGTTLTEAKLQALLALLT